jgi:hypothetical protein
MRKTASSSNNTSDGSTTVNATTTRLDTSSKVHEKLRSKHIDLLERLQQLTDENENLKQVLKEKCLVNNGESGERDAVNDNSSVQSMLSMSEFVKITREKEELDRECKLWKSRYQSADSEINKLKDLSNIHNNSLIGSMTSDYKKNNDLLKSQIAAYINDIAILKSSETNYSSRVESLEKVTRHA